MVCLGNYDEKSPVSSVHIIMALRVQGLHTIHMVQNLVFAYFPWMKGGLQCKNIAFLLMKINP